MFAPQVAARGVPVAEFNMENTPATMRFKYVSFTVAQSDACIIFTHLCRVYGTHNISFCVSGFTSTAPVGPRYPPHWHATRLNNIKNESSAVHRPDCLTLQDFIGTNTKSNGLNIVSTQREQCGDRVHEK